MEGLEVAKTAAFGVVHLVVAFGVGYGLTGSLAVAGAITVVEPVCNMVAHYFFERWWSGRAARSAPAAARSVTLPGPLSGGGAVPAAGTVEAQAAFAWRAGRVRRSS